MKSSVHAAVARIVLGPDSRACAARLASAGRVKYAHARTGKFEIRRRTFAAMHVQAILSLALAAAAALAFPRPGQADDLSAERCRLATDSLPAAFARCGVLTVPENPAAPDGAKVELFVARVAALTSTPKADPLLLIAGGPGQSTVDFYLQMRGAFEGVRRDRDLILVDQRGTGRSSAGFGCTVPDDLALDTAGPDELRAFIDGCVAQLTHDPRFYTTSVAVRDLERVRTGLGIEQWNIYGISYGTRVAQHYLRRFPEHARAVVLDGVVPPALALGPDVAREAQRALDEIFARCKADGGCALRFGDLPTEFAALLARLEAAPIGSPARTGAAPPESGSPASPVPFGAQELRALVRFMSYSGTTVALLPVLLHEAYTGNYEPLVSQASTLLRGLPESLSFAMSNSVVCTEDVPYLPSDVGADLAATYLGTTILDSLNLICSRWPAGEIDADFKTPVSSDKPVLLLSGSNDPITPPDYAQTVAATLSNSAQLVGQGQGHGLLPIGCVPRLIAKFLDDPNPAALKADCLAAEPPAPFFLTLLGPAP
jgi:pimeloyl-ACP methyl ester carboxylesterase